MESAHHSLSRPDRNNTADVPSFTLHTALSAIPICVVLMYNDSKKSLHRICQIQRNSQCEWLEASYSAPRTVASSFMFPEKFSFCTDTTGSIGWPSPAPRLHIDDYCVIHFLHWELCDPQLLNHQNFLFWARLYQHVFCKKPLFCSSSSRYRSLGLSGSECRHCAYPSQVPLLLATPMVIHEKNWKCLDPWAPGFPVTLKDYFHRTNFLWTPVVSPASHAKDRFVLLRVLHVYFCFRFLSVYAAGFPVTPLSYFHFIRVLDFRCICLTRR